MLVYGRSIICTCPTTSANFRNKWLTLKLTFKRSCYFFVRVYMELGINIKLCFRFCRQTAKCSEMFRKMYGDELLFRSHTFKWFNGFWDSRAGVGDAHAGWPHSACHRKQFKEIVNFGSLIDYSNSG